MLQCMDQRDAHRIGPMVSLRAAQRSNDIHRSWE